MSLVRSSWSWFVPCLLVTGCVSYRPAPVSSPALLAGVETPPRGPLAYEDAVRWAVAHNPELAALRARAGAIVLNPAAEPLGLEGAVDMDERRSAAASFDVLSLLGIGPRAAERVLARARHSEALLAHVARARDVAGEIAEVYAVARALASLVDPDAPPDPKAFVAAGVEVAAAGRIAAAVARARDAERGARDATGAANRAMLARALGARPEAAPAPVLPDAAWPAVPAAADAAAVLAARADLQRLLAAYEVADAELRKAVAAQVPGLELAPGLAFDPTQAFGAVRVRLPIGACREAVAMELAREAARQDLSAGILAALADAATTRAELVAAEQRLDAARERLGADQDLVRSARARLDAGEGTALELILMARDVVEATAEVRDAAVEAARARVRAARAAGWPGADVVR